MTLPRARSNLVPVLALLLASIFWGMGFTWAKAGGELLNRQMHLPESSALGPIRLLTVRFLFGTILWFSIFPKSRQGWNRKSLRRIIPLGILLAMGLISQHLGLNHTTEAVSAFLTNLTVIFVPLIVAVFASQWPPLRIAVAIGLALAGIYLMTGAAPAGFSRGDLLGLACAIIYSLYILAIDRLDRDEEPYRLTGVQFLLVAIVCFLTSGFLSKNLSGAVQGWRIFIEDGSLLRNTILLTLMPTVGAYGLMMRFQPQITPTQATLIYLAEPVVATVWAAIFAGRSFTALGMIGAGLILVANVLAGMEKKVD